MSVFGEVETSVSEECCVIVTQTDASLDVEKIPIMVQPTPPSPPTVSNSELKYRISGDIIISSYKECIEAPGGPDTGDGTGESDPTTVSATGDLASRAGGTVTLDCIGGQHPKSSETGKTKPIANFNCFNTETASDGTIEIKPKLELFSVSWKHCTTPCEEDISDPAKCPEFEERPALTSRDWEYAEPQFEPPCCCEDTQVIPIDVTIEFTQTFNAAGEMAGSLVGGIIFGVPGAAGGLLSAAGGKCGDAFMKALEKALKGKMGKEVDCQCKQTGKNRDFEAPDPAGNVENDLGRVIVDELVPEVGRIRSGVNAIGALTSDPPGTTKPAPDSNPCGC